MRTSGKSRRRWLSRTRFWGLETNSRTWTRLLDDASLCSSCCWWWWCWRRKLKNKPSTSTLWACSESWEDPKSEQQHIARHQAPICPLRTQIFKEWNHMRVRIERNALFFLRFEIRKTNVTTLEAESVEKLDFALLGTKKKKNGDRLKSLGPRKMSENIWSQTGPRCQQRWWCCGKITNEWASNSWTGERPVPVWLAPLTLVRPLSRPPPTPVQSASARSFYTRSLFSFSVFFSRFFLLFLSFSRFSIFY